MCKKSGGKTFVSVFPTHRLYLRSPLKYIWRMVLAFYDLIFSLSLQENDAISNQLTRSLFVCRLLSITHTPLQ